MLFRRLIVFSALVCFSYLNPAQSVIYGSDDIREVNDVPQGRLAKSIAIAVPNLFIEPNADGTLKMVDVIPMEGYLCQDERFTNQVSIGNCTAFLVSDRHLVTAGHCLIPTGEVNDEYHPFCEAFSWYFDFRQPKAGATHINRVPADRVYKCKRVVRAVNVDQIIDENGMKYTGADYAIIELDRPVAPDLKPLKIAKTPAKVGDTVFTIGYPLGLPAKFSGMSRVVRNDLKKEYFESYLDTFSGNSGGPVLNSRYEVVGILVGGHSVDFASDAKECKRLNRCDNTGKNCTEESRWPDLPVTSLIQRIETVKAHIPAN